MSSSADVIVCPYCDSEFENDSVIIAAHLQEFHVCQFNHIECPEGCSQLIVENNPKALQDHIVEKHQCRICRDHIPSGELEFHMKMFHGEHQCTTCETEPKSRSTSISSVENLREPIQISIVESEKEDQISKVRSSSEVALRESNEADDVDKCDQFDISTIEQHDVTDPEWKVCKTCRLIMKVETLVLCTFCEDDSDPFISVDELVVHIWNEHKKTPRAVNLNCSFCEVRQTSINGFLYHRKFNHELCNRHYLCGASLDCLLLSDSLEKVGKHIERSDTICHLRHPFGGSNQKKCCFNCDFIFDISFLYSCVFCKMPNFICVIDFMSHMAQKHACKVFGEFGCMKCERSFQNPRLLINHYSLVHKRCESHWICAKSEDCPFVFPTKFSSINHSCSQSAQFLQKDSINNEPENSTTVSPQQILPPFNIPVPPIQTIIPFPPPSFPPTQPPPATSAESSEWLTPENAPPSITPTSSIRAPLEFWRNFGSNWLPSRNMPPSIGGMAPPNIQLNNQQPSLNINVSAVVTEKRSPVVSTPCSKSSAGSIAIGKANRKYYGGLVYPKKKKNSKNRVNTKIATQKNRLVCTVQTFEETKNSLGKVNRSVATNTYAMSVNRFSQTDFNDMTIRKSVQVQTIESLPALRRVEVGKNTYAEAVRKFGLVYVCVICKIFHNNAPDVRNKCNICPNMWFLHKYELDSHYETEHMLESKTEDVPYKCLLCDEERIFETQSAQDLVLHVEVVHKQFPHLFCANLECSTLNHRVPHQNQTQNRSFCRQFLNTTDFDWFSYTENRTRVESRHYFNVDMKARAQCRKCNFDLSIPTGLSIKLHLESCKICSKKKRKLNFVNSLERFAHLTNNHEVAAPKYIQTTMVCKVCNGSERYSFDDIMKHRELVHGFCKEHYICEYKGCFFITSDVEENDLHRSRAHKRRNERKKTASENLDSTVEQIAMEPNVASDVVPSSEVDIVIKVEGGLSDDHLSADD